MQLLIVVGLALFAASAAVFMGLGQVTGMHDQAVDAERAQAGLAPRLLRLDTSTVMGAGLAAGGACIGLGLVATLIGLVIR